MRKLADYAGLQVGWLACVGGAAHGLGWLGPAAATLILGAHLFASPRPAREIRRIAAVGVFGAALESAAIAGGLYGYSCGWEQWRAAPAWIVALWMLFAATFESSLGWLDGRPFWAAAFGAVGSPLSFAAGVKWGAARFVAPAPAGLAAVSAMWAAALPAAFAVARAAGGEAR